MVLLGLCPVSYNLNSHNLTKDSLLNTQTFLRDPCIETSKDGRVGGSKGGGKRKRWIDTLETASSPKLELRSHFPVPGEGGIRLPLSLPSARRSRKIQWAERDEWVFAVGVISRPCAEPRDLGRESTEVPLWLSGNHHHQTDKQSHRAWQSPLALSELVSEWVCWGGGGEG